MTRPPRPQSCSATRSPQPHWPWPRHAVTSPTTRSTSSLFLVETLPEQHRLVKLPRPDAGNAAARAMPSSELPRPATPPAPLQPRHRHVPGTLCLRDIAVVATRSWPSSTCGHRQGTSTLQREPPSIHEDHDLASAPPDSDPPLPRCNFSMKWEGYHLATPNPFASPDVFPIESLFGRGGVVVRSTAPCCCLAVCALLFNYVHPVRSTALLR